MTYQDVLASHFGSSHVLHLLYKVNQGRLNKMARCVYTQPKHKT